MLYRIYGLIIKSDFELEEAVKLENCETYDAVISKTLTDMTLISCTEEENTQRGCILYYKDDWLCAKFIGEGVFKMTRGKSIEYYLYENHNIAFVNQIFICYCINILLMQQHKISMHGSGIVHNKNAYIISGESGAGKSSLTTAMLEREYQYLADDTVLIKFQDNIAYAVPAYPQRRVCGDLIDEFDINPDTCKIIPDYEREKYSFDSSEKYCSEEMELKAIIILKPEEVEEVEIEEVVGSSKLQYIIENLYKKSVYQYIGFSADEFKQCVQLAGLIKVFVLKRPLQGMTLDTQIKLIEAYINE